MRKRKGKVIFFTLIELIVSMSVMLVLMTVIVMLFNATNRVADQAKGDTTMYLNARVALDYITNDIESIYFGSTPSNIPFWHWRPSEPATPPSGWGVYGNELVAFITETTLLPNIECVSTLCEVKYQKYNTTDRTDPDFGHLMRSVTGDKLENSSDNTKWNFLNNKYSKEVGYTVNFDEYGDTVGSLTADSSSHEKYERLIPCVTKFSLTCYDEDGKEITPDSHSSTNIDIDPDNDTTSPTDYPSSIHVQITLMNNDDWDKWIHMVNNDAHLNAYKEDADNSNLSESAQSVAYKFRILHERMFSKTIRIAYRGTVE
ncbi:MAG TPA: prepilin-type N-terminal cleavage/methylation domain-containing protein [Victivallales bacterium]|nr:prepilin-type N-terminal cleavage/methylation domain-containing protein [Victivallales bacterium]